MRNEDYECYSFMFEIADNISYIDTLTKHNYFANKFDATAWNDFDAVPRSASIYGLDDHGGSRKRLMFTRKQRVVEDNTLRMRVADEKKVMPNTRRMNLITNVAVENS